MAGVLRASSPAALPRYFCPAGCGRSLAGFVPREALPSHLCYPCWDRMGWHGLRRLFERRHEMLTADRRVTAVEARK